MSKTRFELLAAAAQTASAQGGGVSVSGVKHLALCVDVTSVSASLSSVYLQGSSDGGTTWFDLLAQDYVYTTSGTTVTSGTNRRDVVTSITTGVVVKAIGTYVRFPDFVRAAWVIAGSGPTATFGVKAIGEN
jgi:hypothetical protein